MTKIIIIFQFLWETQLKTYNVKPGFIKSGFILYLIKLCVSYYLSPLPHNLAAIQVDFEFTFQSN